MEEPSSKGSAGQAPPPEHGVIGYEEFAKVELKVGLATGEKTSGGFFEQAAPKNPPAVLLQPGDTCMVCHNNLLARTGEDVSIGADWRASMMANSARDPSWMAAVRREVMDHPAARDTIEDECSICHMPMKTYPARAAGGKGTLFEHLQPGAPQAVLASDGVSCTVCHQIQPTKLGEPSSFTGGYVIDVAAAAGTRKVFGPFAIDERYGHFRTDYRIAGDFEYCARIFHGNTLAYRSVPETLVCMRIGGISTGGWRNTVLLNREVLRACRENGIDTNMLKICSKYPAKMLEFLVK